MVPTRGWLMVLVIGAAGCLEGYDPPPQLERANIDQGLFDPALGPLTLRFSEPIDVRTLEVALHLSRTTEELDLCTKDANGELPEGCTEEARAVLGPCEAGGRNAIREPTDDGSREYECEGGKLRVNPSKEVVTLLPDLNLSPFERYVAVVSADLSDEEGRIRRTPIEVRFQVKSNLPCGPTDFASGYFFTEFDIEQPISAQFQFVFYVQVKPETGQMRLYGADLDPKDESIDPRMNRNIKDWIVDPHPPSGTTIVATGQLANVDGNQVFVVYPFDLMVTVPRVLAPSAELNARVVGQRMITGAPGGERELVEGRLNGPSVFLGEGDDKANLGAGAGGASFFRLDADEEPTLGDVLPMGVTAADVMAPFDACQ